MVDNVKLFIYADKEVELKHHLATIVTENELQYSIINLNHNYAHFKTYTLDEPLPERMKVKEII